MKKIEMLQDFFLSYFIEDFQYDYWHCPHPYSTRIREGDYFINFQHKTKYPGPFDTAGIPLIDMSSQHWSASKKTIYSPIVIAQFALGHYSLYIETQEKLKLDTFLKLADWLMANTSKYEAAKSSMAVFYMDLGTNERGILSAMAQGLAVSVLCRAYSATKNELYRRKAFELCWIFNIRIEDGGVLSDVDGMAILEEWTNEPNHILNGHLFAFVGIIDLLKISEVDEQRHLVELMYNTFLASSITFVEKADLGFWSRYSLKAGAVPNITSYFYHRLHIDMLRGLFILSEEPAFAKYAKKWDKQRRSIVYKVAALTLKLLDRIQTELFPTHLKIRRLEAVQ